MSIIKYLKEVNAEVKNIKWPTKKVTMFFSVGVILIALLFAAYVGFLDFVFTEIVNLMILE